MGIAILETQLSQNTQIVHSRLIETLCPDNPLTQATHHNQAVENPIRWPTIVDRRAGSE
jgi:hypothetical protein